MRVKKKLADALGDALDADVGPEDIEIPEEEEHGDFAFPVMGVAEGNPRQEAEEAVEPLEEREMVEKVEVAGPGYLNFFLDRERFAEVITELLEQESMGVVQRDGKLLLEFSSPNVAKPMHVGHFRNNAIGDALQRIFRFVGYDVTSENYLGDWGTQYGKLVYAFKEYGSEEEFEKEPMEHMFDLYVKFHEEAEEDEELEEKGREWAQRIEDGEEEAADLWERFREESIEYHMKDYGRMGIDFDRITGESTVVEGAEDLLEEGVEKGAIKEDPDGSLSIEFDELPDVVVKKADGTTLYLSRDLANLEKRKEKEGFDYNLYVVGSEQELHFRQVFQAGDRLGINTEGCEHISYGLLDLPEGGMSSREGRIIRLSDLLDRSVEKAEEKLKEEDKDLDVAEAVGIGAAKYANLKVSRNKKITFDWKKVLSFEGDSGPYLQYSNTRAKSILNKSDKEGDMVGELKDDEYRLLKELSRFPEVVENTAEQREPAKLANYLSHLSEEFNSFYHSCRVIGAENGEIERRRLKLVELFREVTDRGLKLLGIEPLDEM
ncbi:MAG: arginine--tRNA ligase [Candidatus Nanohaloarchaeota archaeon QJJ-7]|nr:arginine--tRNA ligase [Candidatus Nanohaloarchaeota archaeon QJJ-7]